MSTKLEKYLKEHRQTFDVEYPDDNAIWERIKHRGIIPGSTGRNEERRPFFIGTRLRRIAASVIVVLALSYIATDLIVGIPFNNKRYLAKINSEYGRKENEYLHTVKLKEEAVDQINIADNQITRSIVNELKELDTLYKDAMDDLRELGDNEQLVNTIFNIYERKIELLERIIIETNKYENYERKSESEI